MISSVIYTPSSLLHEGSTFEPTKSPLFQILIAKVAVIVLIFLLGDIFSQELACVAVTIVSSLEFWITKNVGRKYLQATWSIDTTGQQDVWIYEANFKSPSSLQQLFWYSQVVYGVLLVVAAFIIAGMEKYSLVGSILIAFGSNYVNFFAFSKIISLRNDGVFEKIADQVKAEGELRETIRLPMVHRMSHIGAQNRLKQSLKYSQIQ